MSSSPDTSPNPPPLPVGKGIPRREPFYRMISNQALFSCLLIVSVLGGVAWPWVVFAVRNYHEPPLVEFIEREDGYELRSRLSQLNTMEYRSKDPETGDESWGVRSSVGSEWPIYEVSNLGSDTAPFVVVSTGHLWDYTTASDLPWAHPAYSCWLWLDEDGSTPWASEFHLANAKSPDMAWVYIDINWDGLIDRRRFDDSEFSEPVPRDILLNHEWVPVTTEPEDELDLYREKDGGRLFCWDWDNDKWRVVSEPEQDAQEPNP